MSQVGVSGHHGAPVTDHVGWKKRTVTDFVLVGALTLNRLSIGLAEQCFVAYNLLLKINKIKLPQPQPSSLNQLKSSLSIQFNITSLLSPIDHQFHQQHISHQQHLIDQFHHHQYPEQFLLIIIKRICTMINIIIIIILVKPTPSPTPSPVSALEVTLKKFGLKKILGHKKFWIPKDFESQKIWFLKNLGPKNMSLEKILFRKKIWVPIKFGSKQL